MSNHQPEHQEKTPGTEFERPDDFYQRIPEIEWVGGYRKGGFHPVYIDDIIHSRYQIVNKLGYGSYATVWLVQDLHSESGRHAALKILAADRTAANSAEIEVLRRLKTMQRERPDSPGAEFVVRVLDLFTVHGPNGTRINVSLLWDSYYEVLDSKSGVAEEPGYPVEMKVGEYPVDMAKTMVAQLAQGVAYLHRAGIVHGDLHLGNVLLYSPEFEKWSSEEDVDEYIDPPEEVMLARNAPYRDLPFVDPHTPEYLVSSSTSAELLALCVTGAVHIKICDFGEAFLWSNTTHAHAHEPRPTLNIPSVYAAPEIIFRDAVSPAVDVWATAVLAYYLLSGGSYLFDSDGGIAAEVVCAMIAKLGRLPDKWHAQLGSRFGDTGNGVYDFSAAELEGQELVRSTSLDQEDKGMFEGLLRKMVCYRAADRISADGVARAVAGWIRGGEAHEHQI
ncbi:kinase-like domain-containing protein [Hygrophoropsis aurantiaca]|uniref:Kinase-like domain-containing protein n=1 Tax=Hygrophoropsis aurantiaca TaxID=72124 RepID=A0ACB8A3S9_9AGAM|nr:kinase-like domain-containing protein [Hygrophoropsis aurantiaca]